MMDYEEIKQRLRSKLEGKSVQAPQQEMGVQGILDSGYQIVCTSNEYYEPKTAALGWLANQLGYEFHNGDVITGIDSFQMVQNREGNWVCIAVCRVARGEQ